MSDIPPSVQSAYGVDGRARVDAVPVGWINQTYVVERDGERAILQRLHPVFGAEVHHDIEAVTRHLASKGLLTPRLRPTRDGRLWVEAEDGGVWRSFTFIEGRTVDRLDDAAHARAAGAAAARFHRALADLDHAFRFRRPGAHDTHLYLTKLEEALDAYPEHPRRGEARAAAEAVLRAGQAVEVARGLPERVVHGDLKATNLRFDRSDPPAVRAVIDLDTLAHGELQAELGDALRSWCNPGREAGRGAGFGEPLFAAAVEGYASVAAGWIEPEERAAIVAGVIRIATELAARFALDVFEDRYFGFDRSRYASRMEHNLARVRGQLRLASSVRMQRARLEARVRQAFRRR